MTIDVIDAARRRSRRAVRVGLMVAVALAVLVYPAALYVNSRLDDPAPVGAPATVDVPWPAESAPIAGLLPADVAWVRIAGVDLPVSASAGPRETVGGLARGFGHTRAGSVLAALHLLVRTAPQVGPAIFDSTLANQVVGEHAARMRAYVAVSYEQAATAAGVPYGQPLGDLPAEVAGVRVVAYTDDAAQLSVLTSAIDAAGSTRYAATTVHMRWTGSDWALVAPAGGRWDAAVRLADPTDVSGFTPLRTG